MYCILRVKVVYSPCCYSLYSFSCAIKLWYDHETIISLWVGLCSEVLVVIVISIMAINKTFLREIKSLNLSSESILNNLMCSAENKQHNRHRSNYSVDYKQKMPTSVCKEFTTYCYWLLNACWLSRMIICTICLNYKCFQVYFEIISSWKKFISQTL